MISELFNYNTLTNAWTEFEIVPNVAAHYYYVWDHGPCVVCRSVFYFGRILYDSESYYSPESIGKFNPANQQIRINNKQILYRDPTTGVLRWRTAGTMSGHYDPVTREWVPPPPPPPPPPIRRSGGHTQPGTFQNN
jgi:hypothetical protein